MPKPLEHVTPLPDSCGVARSAPPLRLIFCVLPGSVKTFVDLAWLGYRKIKKAREDMENRKRIKAQNLRKKNESRARRNVSSEAPLRGEEHV